MTLNLQAHVKTKSLTVPHFLPLNEAELHAKLRRGTSRVVLHGSGNRVVQYV